MEENHKISHKKKSFYALQETKISDTTSGKKWNLITHVDTPNRRRIILTCKTTVVVAVVVVVMIMMIRIAIMDEEEEITY